MNGLNLSMSCISPTTQLTSFIYQQLLFVSCNIVAGYGLRDTGYKKGLFPINNSQLATRNPEHPRDRQTNKLKKTHYA